jgi:alpha-beta hydrolase superfamily lysophospholipase
VSARIGSGGAAPPHIGGRGGGPDGRGRGVIAPGDLSGVEIVLDDAGRSDELGIAGDRSGQPIDVGRLEGSHLSEGVAAELAERELRSESIRAGRRCGAAEVMDACSLERTRRIARSRRLAIVGIEPDWWLARRMGSSTVARPKRLVAWSDRPGQVQAAGHGAGRLRRRRTTPTRRRHVVVEARTVGPRSGRLTANPRRPARQRRVGLVDLRHLACRDPRCLRVVAGQIGVVLAGESPPRSLDLGGSRPGLDAEDDKRIAFGHVESVVPPDRRPGGPSDRGPCLTVARVVRSPVFVPKLRRAVIATTLATAPFALAYRFALIYRHRAGQPRRHVPLVTPAEFGLTYESIDVPTDDANDLKGWFIPARGSAPGPGVALVHGWESARDRTLPMVRFLHAAGFHCLTVDIRGHGENSPELLPISGGEFGRDALSAFRALIVRPEVTVGAIAGHSMGALGAILAGAADDRVAAIVATSSPADPYRLTRQTFRLAHLPIPDPIAYPLAWLTTRVYLRPRGHAVAGTSAAVALIAHDRPILLVHGDTDDVVPRSHFDRLLRAANAAGRHVESLLIAGGHHSWLYEFPEYRRTVAAFLARTLGGPFEPTVAAELAAAVAVTRIPDGEQPFGAVEDEPGGLRSLAGVVLPARAAGLTRGPDPGSAHGEVAS